MRTPLRLAAVVAAALATGGCMLEPPGFSWSPFTPRVGAEVVIVGKHFPSERPVEIWLARVPAGQAVKHDRAAEPFAERIDERRADAAGGFEFKYALPAKVGAIAVEPGQTYHWIVFYASEAEPLDQPFTVGR